MRDISHKYSTLRTARARAVLTLKPETLRKLREGRLPKGDPLPVARVAAIQAAKNTSQIIPYCHPVPLDFVGISFSLGADRIEIEVTAKAVYKTGVEMEALTAASVAALTLYDMLKIVDDSLAIQCVQLEEKTGGKTDFANAIVSPPKAAVLVMSDSISSGLAHDKSGGLITERLKAEGFDVVDYLVIPDDRGIIEQRLIDYADKTHLDLVLTTGGTGFSPRDNTPEAMENIIERDVPGIPEVARAFGQERMPYAMLARGRAGLRGKTLMVNLPGSQSGVRDYLDVLFPALLHAVNMIRGEGHPPRAPQPNV
ncbi:MAG TPA: bifunctional molybdenum cofactor biosynthesis protein MoaC/MoaB [Candidatus Paceibacterota bacterium]|nr:bifunctional molybdenum cofactor biosynthesis protein MoaC/MoaB [Verrucomicrobiota bacterium]HRY49642.1 bifunctional molybdenum cofactor biosynthesis protein MoaC/MoaB [Candidatus Paceibacterota bacterium]